MSLAVIVLERRIRKALRSGAAPAASPGELRRRGARAPRLGLAAGSLLGGNP